MSHYTEGRRWSDLHNAWVLQEYWNDKEELARALAEVDRTKEFLSNLRKDHVELLGIKDELLQALVHLEHNARKSGAEMGLALEIAQKAIEKGKECGL